MGSAADCTSPSFKLGSEDARGGPVRPLTAAPTSAEGPALGPGAGVRGRENPPLLGRVPLEGPEPSFLDVVLWAVTSWVCCDVPTPKLLLFLEKIEAKEMPGRTNIPLTLSFASANDILSRVLMHKTSASNL